MPEEQVVNELLVAAAEKGGVDGLYAVLLAIVAGVVGWVVKRPQELLDAIRGRGDGKKDAAAVADDLARHETKCDARQTRIHARFDEVLKELKALGERLARLEGKHDPH